MTISYFVVFKKRNKYNLATHRVNTIIFITYVFLFSLYIFSQFLFLMLLGLILNFFHCVAASQSPVTKKESFPLYLDL